MRNVLVFKYDSYNKVPDGVAKFHAWGCNYEEVENGTGNFSTAIIEREDGTVDNVPIELIKFID